MSNPQENRQENKWLKSRVTLPPIRQLFKDELMHIPPVQHLISTPGVGLGVTDNSISETACEPLPSQSSRSLSSYLSTSRHSSQPSIYEEKSSMRSPNGQQNINQSQNLMTQFSDKTPLSTKHEGAPSDHNRSHSSSFAITGQSPRLSRQSYPDNLPTYTRDHPRYNANPGESAYYSGEGALYMSANQRVSNQVKDNSQGTVITPYDVSSSLERQQTIHGSGYTTNVGPAGGSQIASSIQYSNPLGHFTEEGLVPLGKYDCKLCGRLFTRPSSLKTHLHIHTGEKPFTCSFEGCGRSFSVLSNMRRHTRVHNVQEEMNPSSPSPDGTSALGTREELSTKSSSYPSIMHHRRQRSNASTSSNNSR